MSTIINLSAATLCEYKTGTTSEHEIQDGQAKITARVRWTWKNNKVSFYAEVTHAQSAAGYSSSYGSNIFYGNPAGYVRLGVNGSFTGYRFCLKQTTYGTRAAGDGWIENKGTYDTTETKTINGTTSSVALEIDFKATTVKQKKFSFTPSKTIMVSTSPSIEYKREGANVLARLKCVTTRSSTAYSDSYTYVAKVAIGSVSQSITLTIPSTNTSATNTTGWVTVASTANTATATVTISSSNGGAYSATRTATLNVPAMSTMSCEPTGTLGQDFTINITRYDSSFNDTLTYIINNETIGTIATGITGESAPYTWSAPPLSLSNYSTSSPTIAVTIRCTTASGATTIGSTDVTVTFTIPTEVAPTLGAISVSAINTNATVAGWGIYLQGYSKCKIDVTGSAGVYGSTITGYTVTVGGSAVSGEMSSGNTAWSGTSGVIGLSGSIPVSITVIDSRGRSATSSYTITVYQYSFPSATDITCHRTDQSTSSAEADDGTYIYMKATLNYSTANGNNSASMMIKYRQADTGGDYSTPEVVLSNVGKAYGSGSIAVDHPYEVILTVLDALNNGNTYTFSLPTGLASFHIKEYGTGVCLGGYSTHDNTVEIADRMGLIVGEGVAGPILPADGIDGQLFFETTSTQIVPHCYYNNAWHSTLLSPYPVGAVYESDSNTYNPDTLFGGTWQLIGSSSRVCDFTVKDYTFALPAINAGSGESGLYDLMSAPYYVDGHIPIAVSGFGVYGFSALAMNRMLITANNELSWMVRNTGTATSPSTDVVLHASVLWQRNKTIYRWIRTA